MIYREININPAGLRTVLVTGLPLLFDLKALQVLESALLSLFEEYSPEAVNIGTFVTYVHSTISLFLYILMIEASVHVTFKKILTSALN